MLKLSFNMVMSLSSLYERELSTQRQASEKPASNRPRGRDVAAARRQALAEPWYGNLNRFPLLGVGRR